MKALIRQLRVFPRRTRATPTDDTVRIGNGPELFDEADEVLVSVTFTWDLPLAEKLSEAWKAVAPVRIGGPATGERGGDFEPGRFLRPGYVITSRGCPNRCWFCSVWRREGDTVRELPIRDGWNVLDDNLLACSDKHIRAVFAMLDQQSEAPQFTGGLEAKRLKPWHATALKALHPKQIFFAYDTEDDLEPLREAGRMMFDAGFTRASQVLRCYCLVGWPKDSLAAADERLRAAYASGFLPMAMLFRDAKGETDHAWRRFQNCWARPAAVNRMCRDKTKARELVGKTYCKGN